MSDTVWPAAIALLRLAEARGEADREGQDAMRHLVLQAKRQGAGFRLRGAKVVVEDTQLLDDDLLAALRIGRDNLWAYLGGPELDAPSLELFRSLGVNGAFHIRGVVPQNEAEALAVLAQIEADSDRGEPAGLIGFDIETQANPDEEVRQPVKIGRDGSVTQRPPLDPLHLRRPHKPRSSAGLDPHRSSIRTAQLYGGGTTSMVLDTRLVPLSVLVPVFERRKLVIHNAAFELAFLQAAAPSNPLFSGPIRFECTMQAAGLLLGTHRRALDDAAFALLGIELPKQLQTSDWSADVLSQGQLAYAALDAIIALRLWKLLRRELIARHRGDAYLLQRDAIPATVRMQARGVVLDKTAHRAWMDDRRAALQAARTALTTATGLPPPETPAQQRAFLRGALSPAELEQWPATKKTRELSTADADLKRMAHIPVIGLLRDIKREEKALSAFGAILAARVAADGRLHASFNVAGAKTGRMRCSQPNLQQLPRVSIRNSFVAADGHVLVVGDYSSMELRAVAEISADPVMRQDFADPTFDPHLRLAMAIYRRHSNMPWEGLSEEQQKASRQAAKPINFGTIYGAGPAGLMASAWSSYNIKLSYEEAEAARNEFFARYRTLQTWMRSNANECQQRGVIPIGSLGRVIEADWETPSNQVRRPWHAGADDDDPWDDDDAGETNDWGTQQPISPLKYTLCCNAPLQGACADITLRAMLLIDHGLTDSGISGGLILSIHDEFVLEVIEAQAGAAAELLERCMVQAFVEQFPNAPLENLVKIGTPAGSWAKAKPA